ncbi:PREDICTED: uncharacterized protein LOC109239590 [Nicotiana attenuata]|uniref:uncharacterized protein LOC109239590 n=1 Tax=Nicotiana attenuata TaxID=49451 RepID=UPI000904BF83|nr:PREDICTED: uncharacterized protein LOC109239590 [Nicotiana attenuata]
MTTEEIDPQAKEMQMLKGKAAREINGRPVNQIMEVVIPVRNDFDILQQDDDVMEHNAVKISRKIAPGWEFENNYASAVNGRVWMLWDSAVYYVKIVQQAAQLIHCNVVSRNQVIDCDMTVVYGYNTIEKRKELWQQLAGISQKGDYYTWTNKQQDGDRIWSRIDRAMGNAEWMMQFGHLTTEFKLPHISNHSPMMIHTNLREPKIKPPFKFFNVWASHKNFPKMVKDCWEQALHPDTMRNIWLKQKDLRGKLKILNETEFKGIGMKIEQAREDLKEIQIKISSHYKYTCIRIEEYNMPA